MSTHTRRCDQGDPMITRVTDFVAALWDLQHQFHTISIPLLIHYSQRRQGRKVEDFYTPYFHLYLDHKLISDGIMLNVSLLCLFKKGPLVVRITYQFSRPVVYREEGLTSNNLRYSVKATKKLLKWCKVIWIFDITLDFPAHLWHSMALRVDKVHASVDMKAGMGRGAFNTSFTRLVLLSKQVP